jgi:hypothetical protein
MPLNISIVMKRVYPIIFSLAFWGILIVPVLKTGVNISAFEKTSFGHEKLVEVFNNFRFALGDRVFPDVIVGKNGWLFYAGDRSIDDYQRTNSYTDSELLDYQMELDAVYSELQQKGIMLLVLIAPDKNTIYPEYMPEQIVKIGGKSRLDQFVEYMQEYGKTPLIDLRTDLIEASKTNQVYYKTDTHWNHLGAYIAYSKIVSTLSQRYPALAPYPFSDYQVVHAGLLTLDIPRIMGMPQIREDYYSLQPIFETGMNIREVQLSDGRYVRFSRNQNQNFPSALIYYDSFLIGVVPLLEPHFRQTTSILRTSVPGIWDFNWIDQVYPDIVIIEAAERFLNSDNFLASINN